MFATDCNSVPYRFKNVNHFIIEANNDVDEMIDNLCNNDFSMSQNENHMEISNTIDFLKHNYSSEIQSVVLIHLSDTNINANKVVTKVKNELGFDNVHVAKKGLEIPLMLSEF